MLSRRFVIKVAFLLPVAVSGVGLTRIGALSEDKLHFGLVNEEVAKRISDRCAKNLDYRLINYLTKRFEKELYCEKSYSYPKEQVIAAIADDYRKGQHQLVDRVLLSNVEIGMFSFVAKQLKS